MQVRNKTGTWNPRRDPPPDLAIEVDITHFPVNRESIYAALGVPELWQYKLCRVTFLKLGTDQQYHAVGKSVAFPILSSEDVNRFLNLRRKTGETSAIRTFRDWVQKHSR